MGHTPGAPRAQKANARPHGQGPTRARSEGDPVTPLLWPRARLNPVVEITNPGKKKEISVIMTRVQPKNRFVVGYIYTETAARRRDAKRA